MSDFIYHIKIKKEYASSLIEDLQQVNAIEIIEGTTPEWQQQETLKRLAEMKSNPDSVIEEDTLFDLLRNDEE